MIYYKNNRDKLSAHRIYQNTAYYKPTGEDTSGMLIIAYYIISLEDTARWSLTHLTLKRDTNRQTLIYYG